jgi:hypothetical protein
LATVPILPFALTIRGWIILLRPGSKEKGQTKTITWVIASLVLSVVGGLNIVSLASVAPSAKQLALQELDLELALRDRVAATVQSRITWALLLQEALSKELNGRFIFSKDLLST